MEKFIEINDASCYDLQVSTKEKRIVTLQGDSIYKIYDIDEQYKGKFFREYDRYAVIDMGPNKDEFTLTDQFVSADGVDIRVKFSITCNIIDRKECIRKAVSNLNGERDLILQLSPSISKNLFINTRQLT